MTVAVVGIRGAGEDCYQLLLRHIPAGCSRIISGGAEGIDTLAERYAEENNIPIKVILPEYKKYGSAAPVVRNETIVEQSDYVLIFWDGQSKGSKSVILNCLKQSKPLKVIMIDD